MRLEATSIVALEVFYLKLKPFILTGRAGGLYTLKLPKKKGTPVIGSTLDFIFLRIRPDAAHRAAGLSAGIAGTGYRPSTEKHLWYHRLP